MHKRVHLQDIKFMDISKYKVLVNISELTVIVKLQLTNNYWLFQFDKKITSPSGVSEGHNIPHCEGCRDLGPLTFLVFSNCNDLTDLQINITNQDYTS